jgi:hypothetical protein
MDPLFSPVDALMAVADSKNSTSQRPTGENQQPNPTSFGHLSQSKFLEHSSERKIY